MIKIKSNNLLEKFCRLNVKKWDCRSFDSNQKIYIGDIISQNLYTLLLGRIVFAKGLSEKKKLDIKILHKNNDERTISLYESFFVEHEAIHSNTFFSYISYLWARVLAMYLIILHRNGENLLNAKLYGVRIGEYVYDSLIRKGDKCTVDNINLKEDYREITNCVLIFIRVKQIFSKNPPAYYVTWDRCYDEGICAIVAASFGATIVELTETLQIIKDKNNMYTPYFHSYWRYKVISYMRDHKEYKFEEEINKYLSLHFRGKSDFTHGLNSVSGKILGSKEDIINELKLPINRKNIVIMSHCLTDWNHSSAKTIFKDYYTWIEKTIKEVSKINNTNWIIKIHPSSNLYISERGVVEKIVKKYNRNNNIFILPQKYNSEVLCELADAMITVTGTPGIEFSCRGVPVIITGKAWYSKLGFTNEPQDMNEYIEQLKKLSNIEPLTREQVRKAKYAFWAFRECQKKDNSDMLNKIIYESHKKYWVYPRINSELINNKLFISIVDFIEKNEYKDSQLYNRGWEM